MNIITISREFGSGGREIGRRLADILGYTYYDREIEISIAERMNMDVDYVAHAMDQEMLMNIPLHFGRTFGDSYAMKQQVDILVEKQRFLKEIASASHCVIVGRAADVILSEFHPFKMFIYADMEHKIKRCQKYAKEEENLSPREMKKMIRKVDSRRFQYHRMFLNTDWGDKNQYHLCVNTTGVNIKSIVPILADYSSAWFRNSKPE